MCVLAVSLENMCGERERRKADNAALDAPDSSIADLVKHSGLAVIKCKEILQTLMKLDLIERKHEESVRHVGSDTLAPPRSPSLTRLL